MVQNREVGAGVISLLAVASGKEIMEHRDDTSGANVNRVRDCFRFRGHWYTGKLQSVLR